MNRTILTLAAALLCETAGTADEIDFNRDVRPILSDACFACHGPDAGQRQADLRLDLQEGLFRTVDGVTIVHPGQPDHSELLHRVLSDDPDVVMPPPDQARKLTAEEKQILKRWIDQGAEWKGHWAYLKPVRPEPPRLDVGATGNVIDQFVLQSLKEKKLSPQPQADPVTLIRRLSFDLTGLPPDPALVERFTADPSQAQWNAVVDELLASIHYAERMTGLWLDLVRYADTNGIHGDNHREVWMYRDWVLNAFHRNMPFDQFTTEQLAGDLLPNATDEQKIASGYNRLLMTTREGGAQAKEYLAKYSADRVRNASTVWMGATMGCCECHDHKFDPYSIRDFYQFAAFFADVKDVPVGVQPSVKMPSRAQKESLQQLTEKISNLQQQLKTQTPELDEAFATWIAAQQQKQAQAGDIWKTADVVDMKSAAGQRLSLQADGSILTSGPNPKHDTYRIVLQPAPGSIRALRLETLRHDSFVKKSLSRGNGNFVLSSVHVGLLKQPDQEASPVAIGKATASYAQKEWPVKHLLDDKDESGWAVDGHQSSDRDPIAVLHLAQPLKLAEGDRLIVELRQQAVDFHNIGRFRLSTSSYGNPSFDNNATDVPSSLLAALLKWPKTEAAETEKLAEHFRSVTPLLQQQRTDLAAAEQQKKELEKQIPETLITQTQEPRTIRVLARGNWMDDSGAEVQPQVPHFLNPVQSADRATRLDLAQWFLDEDNPLVARVFVNRLWQQFFGRGLVKSADDFGSQGSWPTHPELLDWLAVEFRESGWNVQHMIRLIVSSDAYRRSSETTPALKEADPFNKWLARQSRYRIDAELVRDNALAVSGLLVRQAGGPSVKPYQPEGYWAHLNFPKRSWQPDKGDDQYRRGLYTYWCRTFLHPAMRSFDAPTREECTVERPRSNNSLQALVLLNDPSFVEAARALASRVLIEGGTSVDQRLDFLFKVCLSRTPRPEETEILKQTLQNQRSEFASQPAAAEKLLNVGQAPVPDNVDTVELAAWTSVSRIVLNLHETITRR
ncbi:MAG: PSD1 and planctomycete cytochrome C domain-containing protein [Fuerstiella sp.]